MSEILEMAKNAKLASKELAKISTDEKNNILLELAKDLDANRNLVLEKNAIDITNGEKSNIGVALLDRLLLNDERLNTIIKGLKDIVMLKDPTNEYISMQKMSNGLQIAKKRVPLGVICMIYEARPNVTADAFALCLKSGNSVILKGGKEAENSSNTMVEIFRNTLVRLGYNPNFVQIVKDNSREKTMDLLKLDKYIDLAIPRGGAGLIKAVSENATVPVIETGVGNCHIYVDKETNIEKSIDIILNAKTQRPGVCNAVEKLLIHKDIADDFVAIICKALEEKPVEIRGDLKVKELYEKAVLASEDDWTREYHKLIIAIKIVDNIDSAISHIEKYSSQHSDVILTTNYDNAQKFLDLVDSAAVYVNASTRFTDGSIFGLGAEMGISTQKLHARGPMGLEALTSTKSVIYGSWSVRE